MFTKIKKILSVFTMFALLIPNFVSASEFATNSNIKVYPDSEIVNFLTTKDNTETREIIIENTGATTEKVMVVSNVSAPFSISNSSPIVLLAQSTKTLAISYHATGEGEFSDLLQLQLESTGELKTLQLRGFTKKKLTNEGLQFSTNKVKLEKTPVGSVSETSIQLTNTNDYDVKLSTNQVPSGAISLKERIPGTIKAGETLEITFVFKPKKKKLSKATLAITTTDYKKSYLFTQITGSSQGAQANTEYGQIEVSQSTLDLGANLVGTQVMQQVQVKNLSNKPVTFEAKRKYQMPAKLKQGDFKITYPTTLAANQVANIKITFNATSLGTKSQTIILKNNSTNQANLAFNLQARGVSSASQIQRPEAPAQFRAARLSAKAKKQIATSNLKAELGFTKSFDVINTDRNEKVQFGVNLTNLTQYKDLEVKIVNKKAKTTVYNKKYNNVLSQNQTITWNGKNTLGDKVSAGEYSVAITLYDTANNKTVLNDTVTVQRLYMPKTTVKKTPSTPKATTQKFKTTYVVPANVLERKQVIDESLITQLSVNPKVLTNTAKTFISFNSKNKATVTAEIVQDSKVVKTIFKNRVVTGGFHYEVGEFTSRNLTDGEYQIRVTAVTPTSIDADMTSFYISHNEYSSNIYETQIASLVRDYKESTKGQLAFLGFSSRAKYTCGKFLDIPADSYLCQAADFALDKKIISESQYYRPNNVLKRSEAVSLIVKTNNLKLENYNPELDEQFGFYDLQPQAWYMPYMATLFKSPVYKNTNANKVGRTLLKGYKDDSFRPNQAVSRAEFYKLFIESINHSGHTQLNTSIDYYVQDKPFKDTPLNAQSQWYLPYAQIVKNLANGTDFAKKYFLAKNLNSLQAEYNPAQKITRQEIIEFLYLASSKGLVTFY